MTIIRIPTADGLLEWAKVGEDYKVSVEKFTCCDCPGCSGMSFDLRPIQS